MLLMNLVESEKNGRRVAKKTVSGVEKVGKSHFGRLFITRRSSVEHTHPGSLLTRSGDISEFEPKSQGTNEDHSQNDPQSEARASLSQFSQELLPEETYGSDGKNCFPYFQFICSIGEVSSTPESTEFLARPPENSTSGWGLF